MTEMMELVATAFLDSELAECPFAMKAQETSTEEENLAEDDRDDVQDQQANNGGVLGDNLREASPGREGTVGGPFPPPTTVKLPPRDTNRGGGCLIEVPESSLLERAEYPFTVAAHHIIPGNASLAESALVDYMTAGATVQTESGKSWEISHHIGYNVNGSHNGVWLPGNYAIRKYAPPTKKRPARPNTSPVGGPTEGANWSELEELHDDWQLGYVAAACKAAGAQFHDTHENYSERVRDLLNAIATRVLAHQEICDACKGKTRVPPPYLVKGRLYAISECLKTRLRGIPASWKRPWFTSDRWSGQVFSGGHASGDFCQAYDCARVIDS